MKTTLRKLVAGFALLGLLAPTAALAAPTMADPFLFTEHRGATPFWGEDWTLVLGSSNVQPAGPGTSVVATHLPFGSGPDYAPAFSPAPWFPNLYAARAPYTGQNGQWAMTATDATGATTRVTHTLADPRMMPLLGGVTVSGPALAPQITWDPVDALAFPSWCMNCSAGSDIFNYQVQVRLAQPNSPIVFQSGPIPTLFPGTSDPVPTQFNLSPGILTAGTDYLIGVRFIHVDVEVPSPGTLSFFNENMSTSYAFHTAAIPEPQTYALLLAGIGLLGFVARRRGG